MPHKIRSLTTFLIVTLFFTSYSKAQTFDCLSIDESNLAKKSFESFQEDLFTYYKFNNDTIKIYRKFLMEIASLSIDLKKFPSAVSIQLARDFKNKASDKKSIWVRLSDYEQDEATKKPSPYIPPAKGEKEEILTFNYRGGFIQCLKNTNASEDFKKIIQTLEDDANVSTSLIAQKLFYMTDKEINTPQVKKFIAFDIYFSILIVIEKAFG
ncbi:hypothetical protein GCM10022393_00700 [Aquimarina addita]|uniref:Uncharacterized protein n=1 Tax=Aquimarina addita TaxID=870485 RepID=A0ABP7X7G5_9FLAO